MQFARRHDELLADLYRRLVSWFARRVHHLSYGKADRVALVRLVLRSLANERLQLVVDATWLARIT